MESEVSNDKNYKVTINLKNYLSGKYAYFFVTILFIPLSLLYIKLFGVNLIIADEFYFVDYVIGEKKIVSDIFVKHTEHFNFVPISLYTILAKATHLNSKIIMAFSMILLDIIYFLYLLYIYKREK
jgi:hypothetical protein